MPSFQQQVDRLVDLGYPDLASMSESELRERLEPLRAQAELIDVRHVGGRVPFVLVVTRDLVDPERTVPLLRLPGSRTDKRGVVDRHHPEGGLASYLPVADAQPPAPAYLLLDVDRGEEFLDVAPEAATREIRERGRSPLTIEEGIALATQVPELLEKNRCFSLAGSRRDDRRVPALWISQNAPKLGWCWEGNPHPWLGLAFAGRRWAPAA